VELLKQVKEQYPYIIRIILSGHSDYSASLESTRVAHQYLAKPCDSEMLKNAVERTMTLKDLLGNETIRSMVSQKNSLPSPPQLYLNLIKTIDSPDVSIDQVAKLLTQDVAMTAKILQLVNSAFFALPRNITRMDEAVNYLGLQTVRGLVLMSEISNSFEDTSSRFDIDNLWRHSLRVAILSRKLAAAEKMDKKSQEQAFLAGILHDIGYLILASSLPDKQAFLDEIPPNGKPMYQKELDLWGCTHAELGGYLLGLWGLPNSLVEPVVHHHQPSRYPSTGMNTIGIVHVAEALSQDSDDKNTDTFEELLDRDFLRSLNVEDKLEQWKNIADEAFDDR
jgi:HD-like signal output (HDOD) protein